MTKQLSDCCKAGIKLTGRERPNHFACEKCERIIGTPIHESEKIAGKSDDEKKQQGTWCDFCGKMHSGLCEKIPCLCPKFFPDGKFGYVKNTSDEHVKGECQLAFIESEKKCYNCAIPEYESVCNGSCECHSVPVEKCNCIEKFGHHKEQCGKAWTKTPMTSVPVEKSWEGRKKELSRLMYKKNIDIVDSSEILILIESYIKEAEERAVSNERKRIVEEVKEMIYTLDDGFDKSTIPTVLDQRSLNKTTDWFRKKGSNDAVEYVISILRK